MFLIRSLWIEWWIEWQSNTDLGLVGFKKKIDFEFIWKSL